MEKHIFNESELVSRLEVELEKYTKKVRQVKQNKSYITRECLLMLVVMITLWYPKREKTTRFTWRSSIILVSVFLTIADFVYFYALTDPDAMISIVSMVRRSSVLVSFAGGVLFFHEKNLKGKAIDLILIIVAMFFLYLGTK